MPIVATKSDADNFLVMNYSYLKSILQALLLLIVSSVSAQTSPTELAENPERSGGIYHSYDYHPGPAVPVPKGYMPFYISHYGRHGSRYHTSEKAYTRPLEALRKAEAAGKLTPQGRKVLTTVEQLAEDARLRYGDLSPRGVQEHRGIAERMFAAYPEIFATDNGRICHIDCRSTLVPRCILSMAAFCERIKELNPSVSITRDASSRDLGYMANYPAIRAAGKEPDRVADSICRALVRPERLMKMLITAPECIDDPQELMIRLHILAAITQDVNHLNIKAFYDIFTDEELYTLWECENIRRYLQMGPSARFGDPFVADSKPLLRNIIETGQKVIDGKLDLSASLRFGHDSYIMPLLALLNVEGTSARVENLRKLGAFWSVEKVSPMAANIQFIFFRNSDTGDVRVRVLHNELDAKLPLAGGPYYPWKELKKYCESLYE